MISAPTAGSSHQPWTPRNRSATPPNPAAQATPITATAARPAPRAMKAAISRVVLSRWVRPPKGRGILTFSLSARTRPWKHHNRGHGGARSGDLRPDCVRQDGARRAGGGTASGRGRLSGLDAGLPGPPDPDQPAAATDPTRGHLGARSNRLGG